MNGAYGLSGSFGSIFRSKAIGHNTCKSRWINLRSQSTPIYGPVHKSDLYLLYLRSHFSCLPQAVSNGTT